MKIKINMLMLILIALLGISVSNVGASPVTLDNLITNGGSFTVGDKLFNDFAFGISATGFYSPIDASGINVDGKMISGLPGLEFTGAMFVGPNSTLDMTIFYTVTVLDPNKLISDIHLAFNGAYAGAFAFSGVVETVTDPNTGIVLAQASVSNPPTDLSDPLAEPGDILLLSTPKKSVTVEKDIMLVSGPNGFASISWIDQAVSQTTTSVPEPTSLILLGTGILGLAFFGSKKNSKV